MNCFYRSKVAIEKFAKKFIQLFWEPEHNFFEEEEKYQSLLSRELTDEEKEEYKEYIREFKEDEKASKEIDDWIEKNEQNSSDDEWGLWSDERGQTNPTVDSDDEYTGGF